VDRVDGKLGLRTQRAFPSRTGRDDGGAHDLPSPADRLEQRNAFSGAAAAGATAGAADPCIQAFRSPFWRIALSDDCPGQRSYCRKEPHGERLPAARNSGHRRLRGSRRTPAPKHRESKRSRAGRDSGRHRPRHGPHLRGSHALGQDGFFIGVPGAGVEIVVDCNSVEVFAENGETVFTELIYPAATSQGISFYSTPTPPGTGPALVRGVEYIPLE